MMAIDILEKGEINTYRENEHNMLMDIRSGKYQNIDHTFNSAFYDILSEYEKSFQYAANNTSLPDEPDMNKVQEYQCFYFYKLEYNILTSFTHLLIFLSYPVIFLIIGTMTHKIHIAPYSLLLHIVNLFEISYLSVYACISPSNIIFQLIRISYISLVSAILSSGV